MPLVKSFELSTKAGKGAWVEPIIDHDRKVVEFTVKNGVGHPPDPPRSDVARSSVVLFVEKRALIST